jgi:hypothetical protein
VTEYELMELIQGVYDKMGVDATMYFTLVSAFLASLYFMWSIRHPEIE